MLSNKQLKGIEELQNECEAAESIQMKLNWDMLHTRKEHEISDFFHYEDGKLVGFVGLYGFGNKVEICGMVHPRYRRKGIFTDLLNKVFEVIEVRNYSQILLNAPSTSESAKGFLQTIHCSYSFSEYQMKCEETEFVLQDDVNLRLASPDDLEIEVLLDVKCFGSTAEEALEHNMRIKEENQEQFYIIETNAKSVGKLRIPLTNGEAWIYGFAVLPEYQGKGIGRKALTNAILNEHQKGYPVFLEVEVKNDHALRLYESCGFKAYHSQDYYKMV